MPKPTIGFHIRGGDKLSEDVQLVRPQGLLQPVTRQCTSSTCLIYDHCCGAHVSSLVVLQARMTTRPQDHIDTFRNAYPHVKVGWPPPSRLRMAIRTCVATHMSSVPARPRCCLNIPGPKVLKSTSPGADGSRGLRRGGHACWSGMIRSGSTRRGSWPRPRWAASCSPRCSTTCRAGGPMTRRRSITSPSRSSAQVRAHAFFRACRYSVAVSRLCRMSTACITYSHVSCESAYRSVWYTTH